MTARLDPTSLEELGESSTNVANAWAGAPDYLSRGLKTWTRQVVGHDRAVAVRAALAAIELVIDSYPAGESAALVSPRYIDDMLAAIRRWLADPTRENQEAVRAALDVTREVHAWQRDTDIAAHWILEAVDHACLAVWSGERKSYIVPMDFAQCAARAVTCVLHALLDLGQSREQATDAVTGAVVGAAKPA